MVDFEHWQLPLGRRFRALKLWFVLRRFGASGVRAHVRNGVALRRVAERRAAAHPLFEAAAPPSLSLLCFRLRARSNEDQHALLRAVKATGKCFVIHTKLGGRVVLRMACGGAEQTPAHVEAAWDVIEAEAERLFGKDGGGAATGTAAAADAES